MQRYTTLILAGLVVILAALLAGTLIFVQQSAGSAARCSAAHRNRRNGPDSAKWGINFPNQYASFLKTRENNIATAYGGSSDFSHLSVTPARRFCLRGCRSTKITTRSAAMNGR